MKQTIGSRSQEVLWKLLFIVINQCISESCPLTHQLGEPVTPVGHPRTPDKHSKQRPPQACGHGTPKQWEASRPLFPSLSPCGPTVLFWEASGSTANGLNIKCKSIPCLM